MTAPVSCQEVRERLSELIENELPPEARRVVEEHLIGCPDCRGEQRAIEKMIRSLGNLPAPEPPADLVARIDAAIDRLPAPGRRPTRSRITRHAVAALLVVGLGVGLVRVLPRTLGPAWRDHRADSEYPASGAIQPQVRESADRSDLARDALKEPAAPAPAEKKEREERDLTRRMAREQGVVGAEAVGGKSTPAPEAPQAPAIAGAPAADPRALLLAPRADAAWLNALREITLARPDALGPAWTSLDDRQRGHVLKTWQRVGVDPGLRADLEAALRRARDPGAVVALRALLAYTP